jgi:hypothetical protein
MTDDRVKAAAKALHALDADWFGTPAWHVIDPQERGAYRDMARAALAAAEPWQPIETAPKDGTLILAWNGCWIEIAMWQRPDGINPPRWRGAHCGVSHIDQPKLWMPLQPPPGDKP